MIQPRLSRPALLFLLLALLASAGTLTAQHTLRAHAQVVGQTPEILGVNAGHFDDGSNTLSRVLYMQPNAMRLFISGDHFISKRNNRVDMAPWGDGVGTEAAFRSRRLALRADPADPAFINWDYYQNRLENWRLTGINVMTVPHVLGLLRANGIEILAQTTLSKAQLGFDDANDWASRWEYWKFYYAYAHLMLDTYGIRRFQMYNEPNHSASGIHTDFPGYLERLQLASDALQSAFADYNRDRGTDHRVEVHAPVLAGLNRDWTEAIASQMSVPLVNDGTGFTTLFHSFSYQRYNAAPIPFGAEVTTARSLVTSASMRTDFDISVTEFNVHTNATFATLSETLDTPAKFARLGGIYAQMLLNSPDQLYAFKFSQTDGRDSIGIRKNGLAYVENEDGPYNVGGLTGGFEVVRLFNEAFAGRREMLLPPAVTLPANLRDLVHRATSRHGPDTYRMAIANEATASVAWRIDLAEWELTGGIIIEIEEVSAARPGEIVHWQRWSGGGLIDLTQPAQSVWMLRTYPPSHDREETVAPVRTLSLSPGIAAARTTAPYPVRHHLSDPAERSVFLAHFDTTPLIAHPPARAYLHLHGRIAPGADPAIYHVYALIDGGRLLSEPQWNTAPHLRNGALTLNAPRIKANLVGGEEHSVRLVGTFRADPSGSPRPHRFDVTGLLRRHATAHTVFLVSRDIRDTDDATVNTSAWEAVDGESGTPAALQVFFDPREVRPALALSMLGAKPLLTWTQVAGQTLHLEKAPQPDGPWTLIDAFSAPAQATPHTHVDTTWEATAPSRFYRVRKPANP